jgi:hypothetical protein
MPKKSNDIDLVQYSDLKPSKKPAPLPPPPPAFEPMDILVTNGQYANLDPAAIKSPYNLFCEMFTDEILDLIIKSTNQNAQNKRQKAEGNQRPWTPLNKALLLCYLGKLIIINRH